MSTRPCCSMVAVTSRSRSASTETSHATGVTRSPSPAARFSSRSSRRAATTTLAPAPWSTLAMRSPSPLDAPVTMATRSSSLNGASGSTGSAIARDSTIWRPVPTPVSLSADEARRISLAAQGFLGAPDRRAGVPAMLRRLGAVQLDTISVLARSHELVAYARLGPVPRAKVEDAYWSGDAFEYWAHAASVVPMSEWPWFAFRRRRMRARQKRWHEVHRPAVDAVRAQLRDEGPLTTKDLGGAKASAEWWDWSEAKIAVEWLLDVGEVACVERRGWRRVYDLAERAIPPELLREEPSDAACLERLVGRAGRALGVATRADLADHHRLKLDEVDAAIEASGLVPVEVERWGAPAWADPAALATPVRGRHRTTLLSPFDSLIWDRKRTTRVFGFEHRIEAYTPAPKRVHGYYAMPLLAGGRLVGRVDPKREGRTLHARQVSLDPREVERMASALREAAEWVGCDAVALGEVSPREAAPALRAALGAAAH